MWKRHIHYGSMKPYLTSSYLIYLVSSALTLLGATLPYPCRVPSFPQSITQIDTCCHIINFERHQNLVKHILGPLKLTWGRRQKTIWDVLRSEETPKKSSFLSRNFCFRTYSTFFFTFRVKFFVSIFFHSKTKIMVAWKMFHDCGIRSETELCNAFAKMVLFKKICWCTKSIKKCANSILRCGNSLKKCNECKIKCANSNIINKEFSMK